jgi:ribosome-associated protein
MSASDVYVNDELTIPAAEIDYRASRSGGPGGQHVNTSSTRVELIWNVDSSPSLTDDQRERIRQKLAGRISGEGLLMLAASNTRSQHRNRAEAAARLGELLRWALTVKKPRKRTAPPRGAREARLQAKKHRSETKRLRGAVPLD